MALNLNGCETKLEIRKGGLLIVLIFLGIYFFALAPNSQTYFLEIQDSKLYQNGVFDGVIDFFKKIFGVEPRPSPFVGTTPGDIDKGIGKTLCSDSDSNPAFPEGINYVKKGTACLGTETPPYFVEKCKTDFCDPDDPLQNTLVEYYCEDLEVIESTEYICDCSDGKCVEMAVHPLTCGTGGYCEENTDCDEFNGEGIPGEFCIGGTCVDCDANECEECDDGNDDIGDGCFMCELEPGCQNNAQCNDGFFCNGAEQCIDGDCVSGVPPCNDGVSCTIDSCNEITDSCSNIADHSQCENGLFCDGEEVCDVELGCVPGVPVQCEDDGKECTIEFCNEVLNICDTDNQCSCITDEDCDDLLFCNGIETCVDNNCAKGELVDCNDPYVCTLDSCNEQTDLCESEVTPECSTCGNGLECQSNVECDSDPFPEECIDGFCVEVDESGMPFEECDDGNQDDDDLCNQCSLTFCGDGIKQVPNGQGLGGPGNDGFEECDDGFGGSDVCTSSCVYIGPPINICGNGIEEQENDEECDDGNENNNDACIIDVPLEYLCKDAVCGDGYVWNEECTPGDTCEECDDGNNNDFDGCSAVCEWECQFTEAEWQQNGIQVDKVIDGELVDLFVQGQNCDDGETVTFDIYEDDITFGEGKGGDDFVMTLTGTFVDGVVYASQQWQAEWQADCFGLCNPPEFYFDAILDSNLNEDIRSNLLTVNELPVEGYCGDSIPGNSPGEECDDGKHCEDGVSCEEDIECVGIGDGLCLPRDGDGCSAICLNEDGQCTSGGDLWTEEQKVTPSYSSPLGFGENVDLYKSKRAIIGAPDVINGKAVIYKYDSLLEEYIEEQILEGVQQPNDGFGSDVSVNEEWSVVGNRRYNSEIGENSGAAYLFKFEGNNWVLKQELLPDESWEFFGTQVVLWDDEVLAIGATADVLPDDQPKVYIYGLDVPSDNWVLEQVLMPFDGALNNEFGEAVAIYDDVLVVGARDDDEINGNAGAIYVYRKVLGQWMPEEKILPEGGTQLFGDSVDIHDGVIVVGADTDPDIAGSTYIYRYLEGFGWGFEQKLDEPPPGLGKFGHAVSIYGDVISVGQQFGDGSVGISGVVYVYRHDGVEWQDEQVINGAFEDARFGSSVELHGNSLLIGSAGEDEISLNAGASYFYEIDNCCGNNVEEPKNGEMCDDGGICTGDGVTYCISDSECVNVGGKCEPLGGDGCSALCLDEIPCIKGSVDAMFVLDVSGSMQGTKLAYAKVGVTAFVAHTSFDVNTIGVTSFNEMAILEQPLTNIPQDIIDAVNPLIAEAGTDIAEGLQIGGNEIIASGNGIYKNIVLLSDGIQTEPGDPIAVADSLKQQGIEIYSIALGDDADQVLLQDIASSPEHYFFVSSPEELIQIYLLIFDDICVNVNCGNGVFEPLNGEECDDGDLDPIDSYYAEDSSDDDGFCVINTCRFNVCGDGYFDPDGTDDVPGNADDELCDDGPQNGKPGFCNDQCNGNLPSTRVFITSEFYGGDLFGLDGADLRCQQDADAVGLGGTWKAWLSTDNNPGNNVLTRFTHSSDSYVLLDIFKTVVADDWDDLVICDGPNGECIQSSIVVHENGETFVASNQGVWTGTITDGTALGPDCNDWTDGSQDGEARKGIAGLTGSPNAAAIDDKWTDNVIAGSCLNSRMYCFEQ
jgi:cysteine-rich repeat protein